MNIIQLNKLPNLPFNVEEAINQLRINIGFSGVNVKVIMVTSTTPNEGKSFISLQLWRQMAELGYKTLLVDCDIRNSEMRYRYDFQCPDGKMKGLAYFLSGQKEVNDVLYTTNIKNGYIIPVSNNVANPTVLLESERFKNLISAAREKFDFIILDTAPLGEVADALNIAEYADGSLLVVRSNNAPRKAIMNSLQLLQRTNTPILGTVLNRVDMSNKNSKYYYGGYGYGVNNK